MIAMSFYGNGTFFREFQGRKRSISVDRYGEMVAEFAKAWPNNAPWPDLEPIYFTRENLKQQRFAPNRDRTAHAPKKR